MSEPAAELAPAVHESVALDATQSYGIVRRFSEKRFEIGDSIRRNSIAQSEPEPAQVVIALPEISKDINITEHLLSVEHLESHYGTTSAKGLSSTEATKRLELNGRNCLTPPIQEPEWRKFFRELTGFFAILLWIGAALCFISWLIDQKQKENLFLGVVLVLVVLITGIFSYYQNAKSDKIMQGFKNLLPQVTIVLRNGVKAESTAMALVAGDIVYVKAGDKIPADIRIIESSNFKVDNSSLTGESEPQKRSEHNTHLNPLEATNIAFLGSLCTDGNCKAIVIRTGDRTVIGTIAGLVSSGEVMQTPLNVELQSFIRIITAVAVFIGISFFIIGFIIQTPLVENLVFMIGILVANVPEGLLATVTVCLALAAKRMATKNVMVKNLDSVETLGSVTVIASDKTGTLTQNRMTVSHVYYDNQIKSAHEHSDAGADYDAHNDTFVILRKIATLCNNANFVNDAPIHPETLRIAELPPSAKQFSNTDGDASESAFIKFCQQFHDVENMRSANKKVAEVPFNSLNKYQISVHLDGNSESKDRLLLMKGAPERVWDRCSTVLINGKEVSKATLQCEENYTQSQRILMSRGERVLGCAMGYLPVSMYNSDFKYVIEDSDVNFPVNNLTFVGCLSLIDPPRQNVPKAVLHCQQAGIKVIMVTGDHPDTAQAIAKKVHIIRGYTIADVALIDNCSVQEVDPHDLRIQAIVVTGSMLESMSDLELDDVLDYDQIVFARTSPQQKLRIVQGLQKKTHEKRGYPPPGRLVKHIVAMTGDGVNDSPALKCANIGVAMGMSGSDVAREAADIILLDDNFASIVKGVEEGRLVFDNLKKSIAFTLTSNIPELIPFLMSMLLGIPIALTTFLILCIDLGVDMIPAISVAYEHKENDIMLKPPRDARIDRLVTRKLISFAYLHIGMVQAFAGYLTYFIVFNDYGFPPGALLGNGSNWKDYSVKAIKGRGMVLHDNTGNALLGAQYENMVCNWDDQDVCFNPKIALYHAQTAFFNSIVLCQVANLLICKTLKLSFARQGMGNSWMNCGLLSEILLCIFLTYTPLMHNLHTAPIRFVHWLPALPFAIGIFLSDELRKFFIRRWGNKSWVYRMTYY